MSEEGMPGGQPTQQGVPAVTVRDPLIGVTVNGYTIKRALGGGGMGTAYLARQHSGSIDRLAAIKFLHPDLIGPETLRRFDREAAILGRLGYPCVQVYEHGAHEGRPYLAMEYIHGITLGKFKDTNFPGVPMPFSLAIFIGVTVLRGLMSAHAQGIVHRDMKAENVMLTVGHDGRLQVRIIDFGIGKGSGPAKRADATGNTTQIGLILGTPDHMSPEQAVAGNIDARTDQYSVAVMLYELLSGRFPFQADDVNGLFAQILTAPVPPFPTEASVPSGIEECLKKALSKRREDRFDNVLAFADALLAASGVDMDKAPLLDPEMRALLTLPPEVEDTPSTGIKGPSARQPTTGVVVGVSDTEQRRVGAQRRSRILGGMAVVGAVSFIGGLALVLSRGPAPSRRGADAGITLAARRQMPDANAPPTPTATVRALMSDADVRTDAYVPADASGDDVGQPSSERSARHHAHCRVDRACDDGATDFRPRLNGGNGCQAQCVRGCWRCN